jgi:CHAD domain-containing protein
MDVAEPAFPAPWYKPLHQLAKKITSELGAVRDRDVMLEYLIAERDASPPNERIGIERLIDRVERERVAARTEMESFLRSLADKGMREETRRRFPIDDPGGH